MKVPRDMTSAELAARVAALCARESSDSGVTLAMTRGQLRALRAEQARRGGR